ncbi:unnamed protein product [Ambrosiozyma monospora]|uniref:Unnamed protein product n=1 Tax=Ambrosiozyma monospora TaxID=43982 RepID=A0ACB5T1K1_AMBMO|nr:unnamed protein product [Ambrosiozyma monospora]
MIITNFTRPNNNQNNEGKRSLHNDDPNPEDANNSSSSKRQKLDHISVVSSQDTSNNLKSTNDPDVSCPKNCPSVNVKACSTSETTNNDGSSFEIEIETANERLEESAHDFCGGDKNDHDHGSLNNDDVENKNREEPGEDLDRLVEGILDGDFTVFTDNLNNDNHSGVDSQIDRVNSCEIGESDDVQPEVNEDRTRMQDNQDDIQIKNPESTTSKKKNKTKKQKEKNNLNKENIDFTHKFLKNMLGEKIPRLRNKLYCKFVNDNLLTRVWSYTVFDRHVEALATLKPTLHVNHNINE